ncbi:hypothetical protein [Neorickettsia helminthoeca]|nr:hypothetical protein [Neorickettsia helminthoeca]
MPVLDQIVPDDTPNAAIVPSSLREVGWEHLKNYNVTFLRCSPLTKFTHNITDKIVNAVTNVTRNAAEILSNTEGTSATLFKTTSTQADSSTRLTTVYSQELQEGIERYFKNYGHTPALRCVVASYPTANRYFNADGTNHATQAALNKVRRGIAGKVVNTVASATRSAAEAFFATKGTNTTPFEATSTQAALNKVTHSITEEIMNTTNKEIMNTTNKEIMNTVANATKGVTEFISDTFLSPAGISTATTPSANSTIVATRAPANSPVTNEAQGVFGSGFNNYNIGVIAACSIVALLLLGITCRCCMLCLNRRRRTRKTMNVDIERGPGEDAPQADRIVLSIRGASSTPSYSSDARERLLEGPESSAEQSQYERAILGTLPRPSLSKRASMRLSRRERSTPGDSSVSFQLSPNTNTGGVIVHGKTENQRDLCVSGGFNI